MNSHPSRFKFSSNIFEGNESYSRNMHQGQSNQSWMEPRGSDQPFRQPHLPRYHGQGPIYNAYQTDRYGGPPGSDQQTPSCAYRPPSQHNFEPPHSQALFHHSPP